MSQLSLPSSTHVINDPATNIFFGAFSPDLRKSHGTVASGPAGGGDPWTPQPTTLLHPAPTACTTQLQWLTRSAVAAGYHQDVRGWSVDDDDDDDDDDDGDDVDDDGESGTAAGRSGFSRCDRRSPSISVPPVDLLRQS